MKAGIRKHTTMSGTVALIWRLGRCFCRVIIPPGRVCYSAHTANFGDDEVTPAATVRR
jgi:hypothetical protein